MLPEAEPLRAGVPLPLPSAASATPLAQSRLLLALEAILEPLVTVLSLWLLVWFVEGALTPAWLIASVVAFALAFPGRSLLRSPPDRVVVSTLLSWGWIAGLLLAMGFATGHIYDVSAAVVVNWLWFAPVALLLSHWALRTAAPHRVRLQGPPLRAVVVGTTYALRLGPNGVLRIELECPRAAALRMGRITVVAARRGSVYRDRVLAQPAKAKS